MRPLPLIGALALTGCFTAWESAGPWACSEGNVCPEGYACDEGLCCVPGGAPACLTLPFNGVCADGGAPLTFFADEDGDGEGNENIARLLCAQPSGVPAWVPSRGDCDDSDATINSGAPELCDGLDNNCDGQLDEGLTRTPWFADEDGDGYGAGVPVQACAAPPGHVAQGGDCDARSASRHPGAAELCNGVDDDCDGVNDASETVFADVGDDFPCTVAGALGLCAQGRFECVGGVRRCRPVNEPRKEYCDGLDNDCDGEVDEQPDCGGPKQLFGPDTRAFAHRVSGSLATRCNRNHPVAGSADTVSGATWSGVPGSIYHLLVLEHIDGGTWDLSGLDTTLRLSFASSTAGWGGFSDLYDPQVSLCGPGADEQLIHYRPFTVDPLVTDVGQVAIDMPLNGVHPHWLVAVATDLDTTQVSHIELLVRNSGAFTITFDGDAGFVRP